MVFLEITHSAVKWLSLISETHVHTHPSTRTYTRTYANQHTCSYNTQAYTYNTFKHTHDADNARAHREHKNHKCISQRFYFFIKQNISTRVSCSYLVT